MMCLIAYCFLLVRWINGGFEFKRKEPENEEIQQCFACSQFGIPNFHSTTCDPTHQPTWEALAGSSLLPIKACKIADQNRKFSSVGRFSSVLDPRSDRVLWWSRVVLLARFVALAVDPFFFFALAMDDKGSSGGGPCVYVDKRVVRIVSFVRTFVDAMHVCYVWLLFRLAYVSRESLVIGCGTLVWDAREIAFHYLRSLRGFWLDAFVLLPIPQVHFNYLIKFDINIVYK